MRYIENLPNVFLNQDSTESIDQRLANVIEILQSTLHRNIIESDNVSDPDQALDVWFVTRLIGRIAHHTLSLLSTNHNYKHLQSNFPKTYQRYITMLLNRCVDNNVNLPFIEGTDFNKTTPTTDNRFTKPSPISSQTIKNIATSPMIPDTSHIKIKPLPVLNRPPTVRTVAASAPDGY
jgi:hypothetical protein